MMDMTTENQSIEDVSTNADDLLGALLFELRHPAGHVWRLYANGVCEGFPEGVVVVNRALPMIHRLIAKQIPCGSIPSK